MTRLALRTAYRLGGKTFAIRQRWPSRNKAASGPSRLSQYWDGVLMVEMTRGSPRDGRSTRPNERTTQPFWTSTCFGRDCMESLVSVLVLAASFGFALLLARAFLESVVRLSRLGEDVDRNLVPGNSARRRSGRRRCLWSDCDIEGVYADDLGADALASARGRFPYGL